MDRAAFATSPVASDSFKSVTHPNQFVESWVRRHVGVVDHERRVLQIATGFFDLTRDLHGLSRAARFTLSAAALVHDVGRSIDPATHERIGADLILTDSALRLPTDARRSLAYLTLYHRGPIPDLGDDEILRASDDRRGLLKVLALLRAADTLDSRSIDPPRLLLTRRERKIRVRCLVQERCARAEKTFCRPKKFRLMGELLGCSIDIEVRLGEARMLAH